MDADAYLYVRSGTAKSGRLVNGDINDDDAGGGTDAYMVGTLAAGTHIIEAATYEPGERRKRELHADRRESNGVRDIEYI